MTMQELLEAGVHFGHQTQKWDPRMKPYIFGERRGIHIINLEHTVPMSEKAFAFIEEVVASGGDILFVGTKRQAQPVIEDEAKRCGMHYVKSRWLGGTLTNFKTIKASIDRLKEYEANLAEGAYAALKKKERHMIEREVEKLSKSLGGIKNMDGLPAVLFIIDPHKEAIALQEAARLGIPVVALTDTNCNPDNIDFVIPGNDDAIKAIRIFASRVADACLTGLEKRQVRIKEEVEQESKRAEAVTYEKPVEFVPEKTRAYIGEKPAAKGKGKKSRSKAAAPEAAPAEASKASESTPAEETKAEEPQA